ncbi:hypothetical protein TGME49_311790 [Toxoplasma gondii ME49]|uniref:Uncharacterized protein n=3 Tax=Toxoplasma gondii TaxID=5811 RepID=B6K8N7_TOXGV|nr:hypothetical protein TGME49_311790 [Toxoplasma gondii ME49]EPT26062.1 hypothetical protein TGME49_311790 [Toxoplasma gondii ME49]ESS34989.1 hypothetical protein TGVEG_311790 [Toxoplasma gondii VEG]KYF47970.1 hypothetical protein TGARI_311790 [Toxoplasma gondii ARI]CEL77457.1 TPA: hypothetical protein BN1205_095800 [Toxoplasma gondii VEG]|eukprot:XP_002364411.1 hypothetical protein TGME49_311790 [Toxoplasma gondii ME49]
MPLPPCPPLPCSTSASAFGSSSDFCVEIFCRRLDEVDDEPRAVGAILVEALLHPSLCFFAELLNHPKVALLRQASDAPSVSFALSSAVSLTLTELLATLQLFSTGTVEDYREGRHRRRQGLRSDASSVGESSSLEDGASHFPALPPVLLRKLRMLTTLTLASYCRELSFVTLSALLSVNDDDLALSGVDSAEVGAANEVGVVAGGRTSSGVGTLEKCDQAVAVSADAQSSLAATVRVSPEEAETVVRSCIAMGWMKARINREKQVAFVEDVLGRDVNDKEDLEIMEEVLSNFARRVHRAIYVLNKSVDRFLQSEGPPSAAGSCEATL